MSDVQQLGDRITVALDRIRRGMDAQGKSQAAEQSLFDALQEERAQTKTLKAQLAQLQRGDAEDRVVAQQAELQALDVHLQRLRASNEQLRDMNAKLRGALTIGLEPELLNEAMQAEIDALQALRAADVAEVNAILAELTPLIEEATHAAD
ncbi:MAG: hypothetical protein II336_12780 [Loktanella sp.]|nr:hypothetical protein [Loktanella sp.]